MPLSDDDILEILRLVDESELEELRIETEGFALYVRFGPAGDESSPPPGLARGGGDESSPPSPDTQRLAEAEKNDPDDGAVVIPAPMLGTFYRAEAPGAAPFVDVGTRVQADSVVALIEVMKMMNSVSAGVSGTIVEVCAENAGLVEHGAPLFRVQRE